MSERVYKILYIFSWVVIAVLLLLNLVAGFMFSALRHSPNYGINMHDVYRAYAGDVLE